MLEKKINKVVQLKIEPTTTYSRYRGEHYTNLATKAIADGHIQLLMVIVMLESVIIIERRQLRL